MKERKIWLVRHAQSVANRDRIIQGHMDTELTDTGLEQAYYTAQYFKENLNEFNIRNLYSSDLKRTRQTSRPISEVLGLPINIEVNLREANFGKWEGCHSPSLAVDDPINFNRWMENKKWRPEWCESFEALQQRGVNALNKILNETLGNVLIVTHGGIIFSLVLHYTDKFGENPSSNNCGITQLSVVGEEVTVNSLNFVAPKVPVTTLQIAQNEFISTTA